MCGDLSENEAVQNTHDKCFIKSKNSRLRFIGLIFKRDETLLFLFKHISRWRHVLLITYANRDKLLACKKALFVDGGARGRGKLANVE